MTYREGENYIVYQSVSIDALIDIRLGKLLPYCKTPACNERLIKFLCTDLGTDPTDPYEGMRWAYRCGGCDKIKYFVLDPEQRGT